MSDPHRRPYTPASEPPLAFDDRRPQRRGGPAPVTLIISVLLLAVVGGGVFYLYRGGVRGVNDAPRPVGAPLRDVRTPAPPQPQAPDPAAGLSIYKDNQDATTATPAFAPPPEQPTPRPGPPSPSSTLAKTADAPSETPPTTAAPAKPAAKPKPAAEKTASIDKLLNDAAKAPVTPSARSGLAVVQIGAFSSEGLADKGWSDAAAVAPGGHGRQEQDGRGDDQGWRHPLSHRHYRLRLPRGSRGPVR